MRKGQKMSAAQKELISISESRTKSTKEFKEKAKIIYKWKDSQISELRRAKLIARNKNPIFISYVRKVRKLQGNFRKGTKHSESTKAKMRIKGKARWLNPDYIAKLKQGMNKKPTKPEKELAQLLNLWYPNEWKYTGDWSFWIENRNPDFVNYNKKSIIEFDGEYWHNLPDVVAKDKQRNATYEKYGYRILSIGYKELKDKTKLHQKIEEFMVNK